MIPSQRLDKFFRLVRKSEWGLGGGREAELGAKFVRFLGVFNRFLCIDFSGMDELG